jgi:hypothetical protein
MNVARTKNHSGGMARVTEEFPRSIPGGWASELGSGVYRQSRRCKSSLLMQAALTMCR